MFALLSSMAFADPVVLIALDGVEWRLVHQMWEAGELPNLKAMADRGAVGNLATAYEAKSAIVWTTVATGHTKEVHGITDFVRKGTVGNVPVNSRDRQVPAVWNLASEGGKKSLVLGWWASYPADPIEGLLIGDRNANLSLSELTWPRMQKAELKAWRAQADAAYQHLYPMSDEGQPSYNGPSDRLVSWVASNELGGDYDLAMVYLRRPDVVSHPYWKYVGLDDYPQPMTPDEQARYGQIVRDAYRAVDGSIGDLLQAAPSDTRWLIVSDHGMHDVVERMRVKSDLDPLLEAAGFLSTNGDEVDWQATRAYVTETQSQWARKKIKVADGQHKATVLAELEASLTQATLMESGEALVRFDTPRNGEDADIIAVVSTAVGDDLRVSFQGKTLTDVVVEAHRVTGGHNTEPPGIFIAAGPGIRSGDVSGVDVFDLTPTLLYMLGLPYGEDMAGRPFEALFTESYLAEHPVRSDASVGAAVEQVQTESEDDQAVLDELRALGYIE